MDQNLYAVMKLIETHIEDDRENFKVIRTQLDKIESTVASRFDKIDGNVSSLMDTRAENKGASKMALWLVGVLSAVLGGSFSMGLAYALPLIFRH